MSNITDATCDYGLAQTEDGCTRTLSSYSPEAYLHVQIIYLVLGGVTTFASAVMYIRSIKYETSKLQQYNFLFCCYAALTMVLTGADPKSYGHIIPRPISSFLSDSLTAALYSVYIMTLGYWATIIQQGAAMSDRPPHLICLESIAIAVVWAFYILYNVCLFLSKGFNRTGLTYLHLMWSAIMLGIISTVFLIYGLRVLSRLQDYERQKKQRVPTVMSDRMMNHSYNMGSLSDDEDGVPVVQEPKFAHRRKPKEGHSAKIRKILYVTETLSVIVVAAQMYMAVTHTANESDELQCANGIGCASIKASLSYLNVLQVICVWVVLWAFRTIKKKEVIPQPQSHSMA
ncbi:hypothetical protein KRP22_002890 [Phytophthora ramorum]|uniref:THH1/TOM1/TOM3 domain-containing protein n=1 Tax=Phytophthora ramorum TaxID=164328 RepID=H3GGY2_PHYRM|nr:hypothetical protein KRP23_559 [Phytophthora ramorum]KAH7503486.1 hypothetical protein KRP22_6538 [Phytophthora ramorum]